MNDDDENFFEFCFENIWYYGNAFLLLKEVTLLLPLSLHLNMRKVLYVYN